MARISNLTKYPYDYDVTYKDFVIGTDGDNNKTKNFPVVALAEYVRNFNNSLFSDRVISIGEITLEDNNITINVNDIGNVVYINHTFYTKNTPDTFTFTPVTEGVKIILLYALPDEQIFYMLEGVQSNEAIEPILPSGALFIQRIIATSDGVEIIPTDVIISDNKVQITENTPFANIGQTQKEFNKNVSDYKINADLKNQEQDERIESIEGENTTQNDLINDLFSELQSEKTRNDIQDSALNNLEGIYYVWSPTNRTLTLYDREGTQLSQVSLVSLDNEGTDIRYNSSTLSLELYNADNELLDSIPVSSFIGSVGTQLQLNSNQLQLKDSQGNILSTVNFSVSNINGLQTALDTKFDKEKFSPLYENYIPFLHGSNYFFNSLFYVDATNYYYVGLNKTNPTEYLDVNGNIKAIGFKTPNGIATQALTANGAVYDLTTKADLVDGKVPSSQLPSYVDDVLDFANLASFPATGESGKIYIAIDTNITYRWTGTGYAEISASLALGETASTSYRGDRGKIAYDHSQTTGNPHGTTKADIGLGNVDNTSDLNKPISTATQNALVDGLATKLSKGTYTGTASDLVPYNGALQDVNIASNYFKTSRGFSFTFDAYNYFNTYQTDYYNTLEFKSKDSSDDNFGYLQITANAEEGFNVDCVDGNGATANSLQVNINGISSPKAFVSGVGFKTPFGTPNQSLTADGGVYDLNTKADIDDIPSKTSFTHDILVSNWTLVSGKYEAVISNAGILADSFVDVIPSNDNVDIVRTAQIYPSVLISEGSVKVYSKFLPSDTISVTINII